MYAISEETKSKTNLWWSIFSDKHEEQR